MAWGLRKSRAASSLRLWLWQTSHWRQHYIFTCPTQCVPSTRWIIHLTTSRSPRPSKRIWNEIWHKLTNTIAHRHLDASTIPNLNYPGIGEIFSSDRNISGKIILPFVIGMVENLFFKLLNFWHINYIICIITCDIPFHMPIILKNLSNMELYMCLS